MGDTEEKKGKEQNNEIPVQEVTTDAQGQSDSQGGATVDTGGTVPAGGGTASTQQAGGAAPDPRVAALVGGASGTPALTMPNLTFGKNVPKFGEHMPKVGNTQQLDFSDKEKSKAAAVKANWKADIAKRQAENAKRDAVDAALDEKEKKYKDLTFQEAMKRGDISPAEYVQMMAKKAKAEGRELNPYEAVLMAHNWRDDKTPEERKRQERRDRLGLLFDNLGTLAANAVSTGMAFGGGMPVKTSSEAANKRAAQIEAQRKAAQEKMDTALLNARLAMAKTKEERENLLAKLEAQAKEKALDRASNEGIAKANRESKAEIAEADRESREREGDKDRSTKAAISREGNATRREIANANLEYKIGKDNPHPIVKKGYKYNNNTRSAERVELSRDYDLNKDEDVIALYQRFALSDNKLPKYFDSRYNRSENAKQRIDLARQILMAKLKGDNIDATSHPYVGRQQKSASEYVPSGSDDEGSEIY